MNRSLYIIATTSRSGSTHLCRMLTSTRRLGEPAEYYNVRVQPERMRLWNVATDLEYFQQVLLRTSTANAVCGIKVATLAFEKLREQLGPVFELLRPRYIWLRRRDTLRQAISLYRASETDVWHWHEGKAKPQACPPFDSAKIDACGRQIEDANAAWAQWFARQQVAPLRLWYEDVVERPSEAVVRICRHLAVDSGSLPALRSDLRVMRDATTDAWVQRMSALPAHGAQSIYNNT